MTARRADSALADLARIRRNQGMTQEKAAAELGVCVQTVRFWEGGHRTPGIDRVREYAGLLGFDLYLAPIEFVEDEEVES